MEAIYKQVLGLNVQRLRSERALTQKRLASRAGLSTDWISQIEHCAVNPTLEVIVKLAGALRVLPSSLLQEQRSPSGGASR